METSKISLLFIPFYKDSGINRQFARLSKLTRRIGAFPHPQKLHEL